MLSKYMRSFSCSSVSVTLLMGFPGHRPDGDMDDGSEGPHVLGLYGSQHAVNCPWAHCVRDFLHIHRVRLASGVVVRGLSVTRTRYILCSLMF